MEELQDAIEDAQYVNAISAQDDGPRPVIAWDVATEEELATWKQQVRNSNPMAFGVDWTLESAIGLFLFSSFLKDTCDDNVRINFCEQVIRWKRLRGKHRIEKARDIIDLYLTPPRIDEETGEPMLPKKTEIDEYDLSRPVPQIPPQELEALYKANYDAASTESIVGLKGLVLEEINMIMSDLDKKKTIKESSNATTTTDAADDDDDDKESATASPQDEAKPCNDSKQVDKETEDGAANKNDDDGDDADHKSSPLKKDVQVTNRDAKFDALKKQLSAMNIDRRQSSARKYLPDMLFDKAEAIVIESLRRQYWQAFTESPQYKKMDNFHWYKDKNVVPEDFFILRVLGRGGFGLVTGK